MSSGGKPLLAGAGAGSFDRRADEAVSRYAPMMVSDYHRALTRRTLIWSLQRSKEPDVERQAKEAFLSSTFEVFCAPPAATPEESFASMKFLLVFFRADDAHPAVLEELVPRMDGERGRVTGDLGCYYAELLRDFETMGRDPGDFQEALRGMCTAMLIEKRTDKATIDEDEYRRLRKHTVAVPAYTECWRTILGISFTPELAALLAREGLCDLAAEIVYLVNDIGSLERDEQVARDDPDNVDLNLVLLRTRALGNREEALANVLQLENELIAEFRRKERRLLESKRGAEPALHRYLEVLRSTINGNLATMKHLVPVRYPGALEVLTQIHIA